MTASTPVESLFEEAKKLIEEGKETESVKKSLSLSGADEQTIETIINQIKSLNFLKRRKRGILLGVTGSFLLLLGFVITVIFFHAGISIHFVMYTLTSLGALLLLAGLIDIFGW